VAREFIGGFRFCEFNSKGQIFALCKHVTEGQDEVSTPQKDIVLNYETVLIDPNTLQITHKVKTIEGRSIKVL
jgi:hypothetical protein